MYNLLSNAKGRMVQILTKYTCNTIIRVVESGPAQQAMLSEGSDPANPPKQTFELNIFFFLKYSSLYVGNSRSLICSSRKVTEAE